MQISAERDRMVRIQSDPIRNQLSSNNFVSAVPEERSQFQKNRKTLPNKLTWIHTGLCVNQSAKLM